VIPRSADRRSQSAPPRRGVLHASGEEARAVAETFPNQAVPSRRPHEGRAPPVRSASRLPAGSTPGRVRRTAWACRAADASRPIRASPREAAGSDCATSSRSARRAGHPSPHRGGCRRHPACVRPVVPLDPPHRRPARSDQLEHARWRSRFGHLPVVRGGTSRSERRYEPDRSHSVAAERLPEASRRRDVPGDSRISASRS
jgi:hypothetical protein